MLGRLLFNRTGYSVPANFAVPAGTIRFWRFSGVRNVNRRQPLRVQLVEVQVHHDLAVLARRTDSDTVAPCTVASGVRMKLFPRSKISCSLSVWLLNPSCRIGTLAASSFEDLRRKRPRRHVADLDLALRHDLRQREIHLHGRDGRRRGRPRRSDETEIRCARCRRRSP